MVVILISYWEGLFSGAFAVSFREGNHLRGPVLGAHPPSGLSQVLTPYLDRSLLETIYRSVGQSLGEAVKIWGPVGPMIL